MGTRAEAAYVSSLLEGISAEMRKRVFNTTGMLTLGELLALIDTAACVLTNDTGPMHMAFALQRPVVCLVGPADPVHYGMEAPHIITLYAPVSCSPCIYEVDEPPCHGDNFCMKRLSPQLAADSVLTLLNRSVANAGVPAPAGATSVRRLPLAWVDAAGEPLGIFRR
jgi:ADP-heptose:LPS heptosyltransferase